MARYAVAAAGGGHPLALVSVVEQRITIPSVVREIALNLSELTQGPGMEPFPGCGVQIEKSTVA